MKFVYLCFFVPFFACYHPACDTMPSRFNSYEAAISFVKRAIFKREDKINDIGDQDSWIKSAHYYSCNESDGYLIVKTDKGEYLYGGVPDSIWAQFKYADSYGTYYNYNIKGKYIFELGNELPVSAMNVSLTDSITIFQKRLDEIVSNYNSGYPEAPNASEKQLLMENPIQYLKNELKDSFYLSEFKVKVISVNYEKEKDQVSANALFDDGKLAYTCYAKFKNKEQMINDPTFKFINGFRENGDTVINFMYKHRIDYLYNRFVLAIVPMPKTGVGYQQSSYTNDSLVNIAPWIK
jgi:KTSC domain